MDWITQGKLNEFIFVCEAWTAIIEPGDREKVQQFIAEHGSLEGWPNRGEIVQVLYCSPEEEIEYTADIDRGTMPPLLGKWRKTVRQVKFNPADFSTRFQGLFIRAKAGQNNANSEGNR